LEASYGHLPATPFHTTLQKVEGYIDGFTRLRNGTITVPKILLISWEVKGKIAFENSLIFEAQIDDLGSKCCIPKKTPKNNISGSNSSHQLEGAIESNPCFFG
jgi:hypothetical protein